IGDYEQRDAVARFAEDYLAGSPRYPALVEIVDRRPPRAELDASYLFVQGPPGSGKTYFGARMAVELMRARQRLFCTPSRAAKRDRAVLVVDGDVVLLLRRGIDAPAADLVLLRRETERVDERLLVGIRIGGERDPADR